MKIETKFNHLDVVWFVGDNGQPQSSKVYYITIKAGLIVQTIYSLTSKELHSKELPESAVFHSKEALLNSLS